FAQKLQNTYSHFDIVVIENISNDLVLPPSQAFHLLRIIQEAINNAVKHSKGNKVSIKIESTIGWTVTVSDNGVGMNDANEMDGNGLQNIKRRTELSGWEVTWISNENGGTTVIVQPTTI
ncbi:MAG TPA: ATP-binding protein, partial [Flavipsychrobacter sp.]|nr:ATP-binding protein [Flavipsychrobacter sp.]